MALPSSGLITLAQIQQEFGGSNPISLNEYYGVDTGVPGSGTISMDDFHGTSASSHQLTLGTINPNVSYGYQTYDGTCTAVGPIGNLSPTAFDTASINGFTISGGNQPLLWISFSTVALDKIVEVKIEGYTLTTVGVYGDWCYYVCDVDIPLALFNTIKAKAGQTIGISLRFTN